jgi:hypothetical protein
MLRGKVAKTNKKNGGNNYRVWNVLRYIKAAVIPPSLSHDGDSITQCYAAKERRQTKILVLVGMEG